MGFPARFRGWPVVQLGAALLFGCGGGTGGGGPSPGSFSTGLSPDKPLGTLTQSESDAVCAAVAAWHQSVAKPYEPGGAMREQSCRIGGFNAAVLAMPTSDQSARDACNGGYQSCLAQTTSTPQPPTCTKPAATCTATVAELEACENSYPAMLSGWAASVPSCDALTLQTLSDPNVGKIPTSAACTTLRTNCDGQLPY